jgi:23S rRNA (pseudouridine1915-N3)-methyltransferase
MPPSFAIKAAGQRIRPSDEHSLRMTISLVSITQKSGRSATTPLIDDYVERSTRYCPIEQHNFPDEPAFFAWIEKNARRTKPYCILLDSRGDLRTSEDFAAMIGRLRDEGQQRIVLAIGPANGWSAHARAQAQALFSLGRITLPHELASVVLAEQVYRALTILAGHPYHSGH